MSAARKTRELEIQKLELERAQLIALRRATMDFPIGTLPKRFQGRTVMDRLAVIRVTLNELREQQERSANQMTDDRTPEERKRDQDHRRESRRRVRKHSSGYEPVRRSDIIERDHRTCYLCGQIVPEENIHIDHIIPLSKGGVHRPENLAVTCAPCNIAKSDTIITKRPKALLTS